MTILIVFKKCVEAIRAGSLITRESSTDKEFHFQNWFKARLEETQQHFETAAGTATRISAWWRSRTVLR